MSNNTPAIVESTETGTDLSRLVTDLITQDITATFLQGLKPSTQRAYRQDLAAFGRFIGTEAPQAIESLFALTGGEANQVVHQYRSDLIENGLASATINRRLAALRSIAKLAHRVGSIEWTLSVDNVKSKPYRDTSGPGLPTLAAITANLAQVDTAKGARDLCLVRLMFDLGLRRGEVVALNIEDIELDRCRIGVIGKGKTEREWITAPRRTCEALTVWMRYRNADAGPLFVNFDRSGKGERLTGRSVHRIVNALGVTVDSSTPVRPHGIRHTAITTVLDLNNGNTRDAKAFSRHAKLDTVAIYDDNRTDLAGAMSTLISEQV